MVDIGPKGIIGGDEVRLLLGGVLVEVQEASGTRFKVRLVQL